MFTYEKYVPWYFAADSSDYSVKRLFPRIVHSRFRKYSAFTEMTFTMPHFCRIWTKTFSAWARYLLVAHKSTYSITLTRVQDVYWTSLYGRCLKQAIVGKRINKSSPPNFTPACFCFGKTASTVFKSKRIHSSGCSIWMSGGRQNKRKEKGD